MWKFSLHIITEISQGLIYADGPSSDISRYTEEHDRAFTTLYVHVCAMHIHFTA